MSEKDSPQSNLSTKQQRAIAALLTEKDIVTAAAKAGIGERQLHRWLKEPEFVEFQDVLKSNEASLIDQAVRRLTIATGDALDVITTLMTNETVAASIRLRAAGLVLEQLIKLREFYNLEQRLSALEDTQIIEAMKEKKTND